MKNSRSKMLMRAAAVGAVVGAAMVAERMRDNNKSQFEKFMDQLTEHLK